MDWGAVILLVAGAVLWYVIDKWILPYARSSG